MKNRELIVYETIYAEFKMNKKIFNNYDISDIKNCKIEIDYCYGTDQYINAYIEDLKDNVIRNLPELNNVNIHLLIFDKQNIFHQIIVKISNMALDILKINKKIKFEKSIMVCIEYKNKIMYMGSLNFEGIL